MLYAIIGFDIENSAPRRRSARAAHLARLDALQDQGRLLSAGPFPAVDAQNPGEAGFSGSLIVAQFDSLAEAESWAEADPYRDAGVYAETVVKPYKAVYPRSL